MITITRSEIETISRWFRRMMSRGFVFHDSYVVFDVETTGLDVNRDYIVQFGHLVVENCKPHKPMQTVLDWTRCQNASHGDIRQRLYETEHDFARQGRTYKFSYDRIAEEGIDPIEVLKIYLDFFKQHQNAGCFFLTHNGVRYDSKIVASHFKRFLSCDFQFDVHQMIDTGLLEKARQINMMLRDNEAMPAFYGRVANERRKGVLWSLDKHCVPNYGLIQKHGLDIQEAHTAGFDCYMTHLLLEEFREIAGKLDELTD